MKIAVIALTSNGAELAKHLAHLLGAQLYLPEKFCMIDEKCSPIGEKLGGVVERIFNQYDALVFIMAAGIVVRSIAPFIKDKKTDPAVVVLDEKGKNVISLLSGHIGGANELTLRISHLIGANPVITTASDVNDTLAVDMLAKKLGCEIENQQHLTAIAASIINGQKVGFYSDYENVFELPDNAVIINTHQQIDKSYAGAILLTHHILKDITIPHVFLRPKSIVLGIGCRKNTPKEKILEAVSEYLQQLSINSGCIKHIATVDVKAEEQGLIRAAEDLEVPLVIVDRVQIRKVEQEFECSPFVKETIGVGCVAEPCAVVSCCNGRLIGGKYIKDGVTVAVAVEKKLEIDH
ncbi:cobalt-precorrin 5A hydrolase [Petroclostridium sp. X23]|uniref:cobalt-precorrin 5A hydrolase n=1 Tax=Petroclostridium sp. X23 TaxID=3045146 RepID=UPI0024AD0558|nr:cobalt-precorrin 5A hydrolase [Petroclostridium sp. X23]WHH60584.1 cobalt-precorrin 5A hydrolase [Petroclostridium sp. X23]